VMTFPSSGGGGGGGGGRFGGGERQFISGQAALIHTDGWTWEEATLRPNAGIAFNFPSIGGFGRRGGGGGAPAPGGGPDRTYEQLKKERDDRLDQAAQLLDRARAYAKGGPDKTKDWVLDALVPVVERRLPFIVTANREQDIRDAIAFADRVKVNIVISGGLEAGAVAPLLKEKNIPVILGDVLTLPSREDFFHAAPYQVAGQLAQAGVKIAFSTGDSTNVRLVPYTAAISVAWGLDRDQALKALTTDAAEILGIADRVGSIEPGKDANLFISKGDPLEIRTEITRVVIEGKDVDLDSTQLALYKKYLARP